MKVKIDLTTKQQQHFVRLGLATFLANQANGSITTNPKTGKPGKKWTPSQRRKFIASMAKKYDQKRRAKKAKTNGQSLHANGQQLLTKKGTPLRDPRKQWTDEHRKNYLASMAKKRAEGWKPKRKRGAQK